MDANRMRWTRGRYAVEMTDEPAYTFGSAHNLRSYGQEILLHAEFRSSKHGLRCFLDGGLRGSAVLGASGAGTHVHEGACVLWADRCLAAIGDRVVALGLPDLRLLWQAKADDAACLGLHPTPDEQHVIVHGELAVSKFTADGRKEWAYSGKDIFTGPLAISQRAVVVTDFNGEKYLIELDSGRGKVV